jgi:hypothetical protein
MPRSSNRGRNNNPSGRNQYSSDWGVTELVRDRPFAAAAAAAGAAAAGLFLWSRRAQISNQLSNLSDQIGEWTENMRSDWSSGDDTAGLTTGRSSNESTGNAGSSRNSRSSQRNSGSGRTTSSRTRGMSETGGGNASLGASSGGGGSSGSASGRAESTPTTQQ